MMNQKTICTYHFGYSYVVAERAPAGWVRICAPRLSLVSGAVAGRAGGARSGSSPRDRGRFILFAKIKEKKDQNILDSGGRSRSGDLWVMSPARYPLRHSAVALQYQTSIRCRLQRANHALSMALVDRAHTSLPLSLSPFRRPYQVVPCVHSARALVACSSSAPRPSRHDVSSLPALCIANALRSRACMASVNGASFAASRLCSSITLVSCRDGEGAPCWST